MGQILHGYATTTEAMRRAIQNSKESLKTLSERYSVNEKTIAKWRKRDYVHDTPMEPKDPHSTVLSREEEAVCVAFRKHTLLPLDDCLYALQESIPHLTRSSLHRLYQPAEQESLGALRPRGIARFSCYAAGRCEAKNSVKLGCSAAEIGIFSSAALPQRYQQIAGA